MLAQGLNGLVIGGAVTPNWLEGDKFWYTSGGKRVLIDPAKASRVECDSPIACCLFIMTPRPGLAQGRGRC